ncbi:hypothetical protein V8B97DRAFT_1918392 [Scleroderma yunnanense]
MSKHPTNDNSIGNFPGVDVPPPKEVLPILIQLPPTDDLLSLAELIVFLNIFYGASHTLCQLLSPHTLKEVIKDKIQYSTLVHSIDAKDTNLNILANYLKLQSLQGKIQVLCLLIHPGGHNTNIEVFLRKQCIHQSLLYRASPNLSAPLDLTRYYCIINKTVGTIFSLLGGGHCEPTPPVQTPTCLCQKIRATSWDAGLIQEAQAHHSQMLVPQDPITNSNTMDMDNDNPFLPTPQNALHKLIWAAAPSKSAIQDSQYSHFSTLDPFCNPLSCIKIASLNKK